MSNVSPAGPGRPRRRTKRTRDIRAVIRDSGGGQNALRIQEWIDRVAETDPAEAVRLCMVLLRFVTPT